MAVGDIAYLCGPGAGVVKHVGVHADFPGFFVGRGEECFPFFLVEVEALPLGVVECNIGGR